MPHGNLYSENARPFRTDQERHPIHPRPYQRDAEPRNPGGSGWILRAAFPSSFTATTGESAVGYVRRLRLERAGRKLRMGAVDITEVALAAGYDSHAAFGKAFKQQFGLSPSEFRQLSCREATQLLTRGFEK
ncbi:MAG: helix-turn-helix transcriptional regulator [Anaerolineales bacterium]|nr:helix-turn-helix transcriptional regulator [Anaerolineales bacterium]